MHCDGAAVGAALRSQRCRSLNRFVTNQYGTTVGVGAQGGSFEPTSLQMGFMTSKPNKEDSMEGDGRF